MKKVFLLLTIFCISQACRAQLILTNPLDISLSDINFNANVIFENKIKSIKVSISEKPDGEVITDKGEESIYRFNENGYLRRYTYSILNQQKTQEYNKGIRKGDQEKIQVFQYDKVNVYVFYDSKNQPIAKRIRRGDYFHTYYYEYYKHGEIRKEYHCNEKNCSEDPNVFKLGEQTLLSYDLFEYINLTNTQTKKNFLNDNLDVYKKGIINYDTNNNKLSESSEFIISCTRSENTYTYDDHNRMKKHIFESNENSKIKWECNYIYDDSGNLLSEKKVENDILTNDIQYLYDPTSKLLKTKIIRDHINSSVIIKRFEYTFY